MGPVEEAVEHYEPYRLSRAHASCAARVDARLGRPGSCRHRLVLCPSSSRTQPLWRVAMPISTPPVPVPSRCSPYVLCVSGRCVLNSASLAGFNSPPPVPVVACCSTNINIVLALTDRQPAGPFPRPSHSPITICSLGSVPTPMPSSSPTRPRTHRLSNQLPPCVRHCTRPLSSLSEPLVFRVFTGLHVRSMHMHLLR